MELCSTIASFISSIFVENKLAVFVCVVGCRGFGTIFYSCLIENHSAAFVYVVDYKEIPRRRASSVGMTQRQDTEWIVGRGFGTIFHCVPCEKSVSHLCLCY